MVSEAIRMEREKRKTMRQAANIELQRELMRDLTTVIVDPLWSSVLGFAVVHELRKANMVGPVADDILYGGIVAINTARSGVASEARQGAVGLAEAASNLVGGMKDVTGAIMALVPK